MGDHAPFSCCRLPLRAAAGDLVLGALIMKRSIASLAPLALAALLQVGGPMASATPATASVLGGAATSSLQSVHSVLEQAQYYLQ